jgi:hypothetical protein
MIVMEVRLTDGCRQAAPPWPSSATRSGFFPGEADVLKRFVKELLKVVLRKKTCPRSISSPRWLGAPVVGYDVSAL